MLCIVDFEAGNVNAVELAGTEGNRAWTKRGMGGLMKDEVGARGNFQFKYRLDVGPYNNILNAETNLYWSLKV